MSAGLARSETGRRARLSVQPRREDVEVGRQCRRPEGDGRSLRARSGALFLPARSPVRPGRQLFARGDRRPHERRSRQRHRQSGAALADDDRQGGRTHARLARGDAGQSRISRCSRAPTRSLAKRAGTCGVSRSISISAPFSRSCRRPIAISPPPSPGGSPRAIPARMGLVLYVTIETLRIAAILLQPAMPASMGALLDLLGVPPEARTFAALDAGEGTGRLDAPPSARAGQGAAPAHSRLSSLCRSGGGEVRAGGANDDYRQPLPPRFSRLRR